MATAELAAVYGWSPEEVGNLWADEVEWWVEKSRRERARRSLEAFNNNHGGKDYAKDLEKKANEPMPVKAGNQRKHDPIGEAERLFRFMGDTRAADRLRDMRELENMRARVGLKPGGMRRERGAAT